MVDKVWVNPKRGNENYTGDWTSNDYVPNTAQCPTNRLNCSGLLVTQFGSYV